MSLLNSRALVELLNAGHRSHSLIANNLANLNTPGYRAGRVRFTTRLEELLGPHGELADDEPLETEIYRPLFSDAGPDGNDVTLAREIAALNKNSLRMQIYLSVLRNRIHKLRDAIRGDR